tara:strand:- start:219 stop:473 length:255 start_codon:yes stop_codon:yes gene_type:complete
MNPEQPAFDINYIIRKTKNKFGSEVANIAVANLVKQGLLEQYVDEDGNFRFALTDEGEQVAEFLEKNPEMLLDDDSDNEKYEKD